jgi:copper chaperone CopZ
MHRIAFTAALMLAFSAHAQTTKMTVNGMVCSFCAQGIEKRLKALPQTKAVYVNLAGNLVAVEPKPGQSMDPAILRKEVTEAGYDVAAIETTDESISAIRAASKK